MNREPKKTPKTAPNSEQPEVVIFSLKELQSEISSSKRGSRTTFFLMLVTSLLAFGTLAVLSNLGWLKDNLAAVPARHSAAERFEWHIMSTPDAIALVAAIAALVVTAAITVAIASPSASPSVRRLVRYSGWVDSLATGAVLVSILGPATAATQITTATAEAFILLAVSIFALVVASKLYVSQDQRMQDARLLILNNDAQIKRKKFLDKYGKIPKTSDVSLMVSIIIWGLTPAAAMLLLEWPLQGLSWIHATPDEVLDFFLTLSTTGIACTALASIQWWARGGKERILGFICLFCSLLLTAIMSAAAAVGLARDLAASNWLVPAVGALIAMTAGLLQVFLRPRYSSSLSRSVLGWRFHVEKDLHVLVKTEMKRRGLLSKHRARMRGALATQAETRIGKTVADKPLES